ncbi:MAG: hypothetical protein LBC20_12555 [Planctomycetaceae bacterium]|jgi:transcriptional regulator with XRE-family HTH domain|nr:hypothetical protein [Planctomycetaceae bacterium]
MKSASKLDYILKALNITGTEVSAELQIDATTVSKWRNNQRRIPYKNGQSRQLSEFLLRKEKEIGISVIFNILKTIKTDINPESREQQIEALSFWLAEKKIEPPNFQDKPFPVFTPKNGYNTNISIFLDENGIDEAIAYYLDYVLRLPPVQTIFLVDHSGINWVGNKGITEEQVRINTCMQYFHAISRYGHKLLIIDCDTDIYRPYRAIFRWMELYLLDGVEVWSHPPMHDDSYHYTNFVVENEIVLQCVTNVDFDQKPHSMLYTNKETINFFVNNTAGILRKSKRLIESISASDISAFLDIARKSLKPNRNLYMLNPSLTLQIIDTELLREILEANNIAKSKIEECVSTANEIRQLQTEHLYSSICNLDILENFVTSEHVEDCNLSEICATKIILSKEHLKKITDSIMKSSLYRNNNIVFTSFGYLNVIPDNLSILVQEDGFVAAWNVKRYKKRLYCFNLDVISGFYRYIDDFKTIIPKICWDKDWRDKQLRRIEESL